jgi:hypothetical protein
MACPAIIGSEFLTPGVACKNIKEFRHYFKTVQLWFGKKKE